MACPAAASTTPGLLATLQDRIWVRRKIVEPLYELSHSTENIFANSKRAHPLAELTAPILVALKEHQFGWPSELVVPVQAGKLELIESTRQRGLLAPNHTGLGINPSIVFSAHGRTLLAHCNDHERELHFNAILESGTKEEIQWLKSGQLEQTLQKGKLDGFSIREHDYWAKPYDVGPELGSLAVPIFVDENAYGGISLLWLKNEVSLDELISSGCIKRLKQAAQNISNAVSKANLTIPKLKVHI